MSEITPASATTVACMPPATMRKEAARLAETNPVARLYSRRIRGWRTVWGDRPILFRRVGTVEKRDGVDPIQFKNDLVGVLTGGRQLNGKAFLQPFLLAAVAACPDKVAGASSIIILCRLAARSLRILMHRRRVIIGGYITHGLCRACTKKVKPTWD